MKRFDSHQNQVYYKKIKDYEKQIQTRVELNFLQISSLEKCVNNECGDESE
jgi:hypothetical protein